MGERRSTDTNPIPPPKVEPRHEPVKAKATEEPKEERKEIETVKADTKSQVEGEKVPKGETTIADESTAVGNTHEESELTVLAVEDESPNEEEDEDGETASDEDSTEVVGKDEGDEIDHDDEGEDTASNGEETMFQFQNLTGSLEGDSGQMIATLPLSGEIIYAAFSDLYSL